MSYSAGASVGVKRRLYVPENKGAQKYLREIENFS
jgi:hypothetical protein